MKKFDLELALSGHPLVTRDGRKVVRFFKWACTGFEKEYPYSADIDINGDIFTITYTKDGTRLIDGKTSSYDLFLDDSVEYKKVPKYGDVIEIYDKSLNAWFKRVFVSFGDDDSVLCVVKGREKSFEIGDSFDVYPWKNGWKWPEEQKDEIKIDITINGEKIDTKLISDETLNRLKKDLSSEF